MIHFRFLFVNRDRTCHIGPAPLKTSGALAPQKSPAPGAAPCGVLMPRKKTKRSEVRSRRSEVRGQRLETRDQRPMVSQRPQVKGLEGQRRVGTPRGERHRVIESMNFVEGFGERNCANEIVRTKLCERIGWRDCIAGMRGEVVARGCSKRLAARAGADSGVGRRSRAD